MHPAPPEHGPRRFRTWLTAGLLASLTFAVFARALSFGFVTFDDPYYVHQNRHVQSGLNAESVRWALTTFEASNWHPLTWLSLELDTSLWGSAARGYHMTNVLLHAAN